MATPAGEAPPRPQGPCDIYAAAGDPCTAAHSTTRALYASYNGPLYQVLRQSDGKTLNCAGTSKSSAPVLRVCARNRSRSENILAHHNYTTESTRNLLAALETGRAGEFRPEGVLADFIDVDPAWERAAEEFCTTNSSMSSSATGAKLSAA